MEDKPKSPDDPNENRQIRIVPGIPSVRESAAASPPAHEVERRLDSLIERVRSMKPDSSLVWLEDRLHVFDPVLDLRVKVEAVRLMLRAAEHLSDRDKERVLLTVRNSLEQLEKAVELGVHAA